MNLTNTEPKNVYTKRLKQRKKTDWLENKENKEARVVSLIVVFTKSTKYTDSVSFTGYKRHQEDTSYN